MLTYIVWINCVHLFFFGIIHFCSAEEFDWSKRWPKNVCVKNEHYKKPWNTDKPTEVFVTLMIMDLYDMSQERMQFGLQFFMLLKWRDKILNVTGIDLEHAETIPDDILNCMWKPDIIFLLCKNPVLILSTIPNRVYKILPTGDMYHYSRYQLTVNCHMDFRAYPMDRQICALQLEFLYSRDMNAKLRWMGETKGDVKPPSVYLRSYVKNTQFFMEPPIAEKEEIHYISGNTTDLRCKFIFVRYITSSLINTYIPSLLIVCLSFVSFWLDVYAVPGRITLGVTALLTLSTQIVSARNALPQVNYMTALDIWLFGCLVLVILSLVEFTLANLIARNRNKANATAPVSTNDCKQDNGIEPPKINALVKNVQVSSNVGTSCFIDIDRLSRFVFPFTLILFSTLYWYLFLKSTNRM